MADGSQGSAAQDAIVASLISKQQKYAQLIEEKHKNKDTQLAKVTDYFYLTEIEYYLIFKLARMEAEKLKIKTPEKDKCSIC